jgi:hypothetical protein
MNEIVATRAASFEAIAGPGMEVRLKLMQADDELSLLFDFLGDRRFNGIIELGVAGGRTSWILAGLLRPGGVIAGVDAYSSWADQCRKVGRRTYAALVKAGFVARLFEQRTADALPAVTKFLKGGKHSVEYMHVDASHVYAGVLADLRDYRPLVSDRGFIQFHDIVTRKPKCEVWRAWEEIKKRYPRHHEFITDTRNDMGIGLVEC